MDRLQDMLEVNRTALTRAAAKLRFAPLLAVAYLLYQVVLWLVSLLGMYMEGPASFLFGFVRYIVNVALLAHFLSLLVNVVRYNRLSKEDLLARDFRRLIGPISQVYFIIYLIELAYSLLAGSWLPGTVSFIILMLWELAKTPVPESVYLGNQYGMGALMHTLEFWRENWAPWLPVAVIGILIQNTAGSQAGVLALRSIPHFILVNFLIGLAAAAWYILRGELFDILDGSSLRSRSYRRRSGL